MDLLLATVALNKLLLTTFLRTLQEHLPFSSSLAFKLQLNITFVFPVFIFKLLAGNPDVHCTIY